MRKLKLLVELSYDDEVMHGTDKDSIDWFESGILMQEFSEEMLILHSNEIGDEVGEIKVLEIISETVEI